MKLYVTRNPNGALSLHFEEPILVHDIMRSYWFSDYESSFFLPKCEFPELTFENSPMEVRLMREDVVEANYKAIADYEDFLGLVSFMRKAQKDQEIISARVLYKREQGHKITKEDYDELAKTTNKVVELEEKVDKWLEENV